MWKTHLQFCQDNQIILPGQFYFFFFLCKTKFMVLYDGQQCAKDQHDALKFSSQFIPNLAKWIYADQCDS
uniref:Uncharacterized protein n=1 Tax=Rhizophora mucronata TaxID=61149 RepID=A0A2P2MBM4_RHIMU